MFELLIAITVIILATSEEKPADSSKPSLSLPTIELDTEGAKSREERKPVQIRNLWASYIVKLDIFHLLNLLMNIIHLAFFNYFIFVNDSLY